VYLCTLARTRLILYGSFLAYARKEDDRGVSIIGGVTANTDINFVPAPRGHGNYVDLMKYYSSEIFKAMGLPEMDPGSTSEALLSSHPCFRYHALSPWKFSQWTPLLHRVFLQGGQGIEFEEHGHVN
jgi:hypothetical protein